MDENWSSLVSRDSNPNLNNQGTKQKNFHKWFKEIRLIDVKMFGVWWGNLNLFWAISATF